MNSMATPTETGAFLQMIEYRTGHPEEIRAIIDHWLAAIGRARSCGATGRSHGPPTDPRWT